MRGRAESIASRQGTCERSGSTPRTASICHCMAYCLTAPPALDECASPHASIVYGSCSFVSRSLKQGLHPNSACSSSNAACALVPRATPSTIKMAPTSKLHCILVEGLHSSVHCMLHGKQNHDLGRLQRMCMFDACDPLRRAVTHEYSSIAVMMVP
jgi:hypothetical protein